MPIPNPDIALKLQQQAAYSNNFFGQSVTHRKYISASGGNPEFGIGDTWIYQERPAIANMRELTPQEVQQVGGQVYRGGYYMYTLFQPDARDEIRYPVAPTGEIFRVASQPVVTQIGANLYFGFIALRGSVTGTY